MQFDESLLEQITIDVCQSMLGLELIPCAPQMALTHLLVASVEIRGATTSIIEVFANDHLIASIAEVMFNADRGNLSESDIRDAFCEIANMIGGNVKGCSGEDASLSLPKFGTADESPQISQSASLQTAFLCCGQPLRIVLRELDSAPTEILVAAVE